jgi:hypothetical protein
MSRVRALRADDANAVMTAAATTFPPGNPYGVLGFGFGRRTRSGRTSQTRCLNAYVLHKHAEPEHPVPAIAVDAIGLVVKPNVVGVGSFPKAHDAGPINPPMTGLYPGAAILAQGRVPQFGGVACVLGDASGPTHLLTAGHLFPTGQVNVEVLGAMRGGPRVVIGRLAVDLLDQPFSAMAFPMDAALVALTPQGVQIVQRSSEGPRLADVLDTDAMSAIAVTAFLATAHDFSHPTTTLDGPVTIELSSKARDTYTVSQGIGTHAAITNEGDSGTILFNGRSESALAVGICVGELGSMAVCEPVVRALAVLRQGTGLSLLLQ